VRNGTDIHLQVAYGDLVWGSGVCILFVAGGLYAANKEQKRLENSGIVMEEIMNTPENIPQEILEKAECVIVFPSVLKLAVGFGGSYGRGAMVCRTGAHFNGPWALQPCTHLKVGASGFNSVDKQRTWFSWS
jgi:lipid-binding SYLF domain-containing protein